jgi:hypothetical protein
MVEVVGNLWTYPADVRCVTTNGYVRKDGRCVMGRGCAWEATQRYPGIDKVLGDAIKAKGNHVHWLRGDKKGEIIFSFPVKHHWHEEADPELIRRSSEELLVAVETGPLTVVLPRPGCGNGRLKWSDVKPILEDILDDRFHVISFK